MAGHDLLFSNGLHLSALSFHFKEFPQKQIVLNFIKKLSVDYAIPIQAFSISMTHHHLMFYADKGEKVSFVKRFLKNNISREYKKIYQVPYKEFWQSTIVLYIKNRRTLQAVQGYIIGNLLKHKEVANFHELYESPFSSFRFIVDRHGFEAAREVVLKTIALEENSYGGIKLTDIRGMLNQRQGVVKGKDSTLS